MNDEDFYRDLSLDVDDAHAARPEANNAPPALWQQIRAQYGLEKEDTTMTMTTTFIAPLSPLPLHDHERNSRLSRYVNIAATVAVVAALALGSWFTAMNLGGDKEPEPRWAVVTGTPQDDQTCDVEPMTVDEVMAIVENPYSYVASDAYPEKSQDLRNSKEEFRDVYPMIGASLVSSSEAIPTQGVMDDAMAMLDTFMACMQQHGTMDYALRFADPFSIQDQIRRQFPFYRDETSVREYVSALLRTISVYSSAPAVFDGKDLPFAPNRDRENATLYPINLGLGFDQLLFVGSDVRGDDGETYTLLPPWKREGGESDTRPGFIYTLAHSKYSDQWYVVMGDWVDPIIYG